MSRGDQLTYKALKKEYNRLDKAVNKAQAEYDEYMNIHHELIDIRKEFAAIVKSKDHGPDVLKKLDVLKKRSEKAERVRKKDLLKLIDKHIELKLDRDSIGDELARINYRMELKGRKSQGIGGNN